MSRMTPTQRSMAWLRQRGYLVQRVEHWNAFARCRIDLFGFGDLACLKRGQTGVLAVNPTTDTHLTAHLAKYRGLLSLRLWLGCGNAFELHAWAKRGGRGRRKLWRLRRIPLDINFFTASRN